MFLLLVLFGAALTAPLNVLYVLAPVPLKHSSTDSSKLVAVIPANSSKVVIKFDKPIEPEIEKTVEVVAAFKIPEKIPNDTKIVPLKVIGDLKKPVVIGVKDKKSGDSVKVMIKAE